MNNPAIYIIAGPNGAGKSTLAFSILPDFLKMFDFLNPDEIARGLSPLAPSRADRKAGEIFLKRMDEYIEQRASFAFETTASGTTHLHRIRQAKLKGYEVHLLYLYVSSVDVCLARIRHRVKQGGHNVPDDYVKRRYHRGALHIYRDYLPLADTAHLYLADQVDKTCFAFKTPERGLVILHNGVWKSFIDKGDPQ